MNRTAWHWTNVRAQQTFKSLHAFFEKLPCGSRAKVNTKENNLVTILYLLLRFGIVGELESMPADFGKRRR